MDFNFYDVISHKELEDISIKLKRISKCKESVDSFRAFFDY